MTCIQLAVISMFQHQYGTQSACHKVLSRSRELATIPKWQLVHLLLLHPPCTWKMQMCCCLGCAGRARDVCSVSSDGCSLLLCCMPTCRLPIGSGSQCSLVVRILRCGRRDPGSNPGTDKRVLRRFCRTDVSTMCGPPLGSTIRDCNRDHCCVCCWRRRLACDILLSKRRCSTRACNDGGTDS